MELTPTTTECIAVHRALVEHDPVLTDAFARHLFDPVRFGSFREHQAQRDALVERGVDVVPSLLVLTIAAQTDLAPEQVIDLGGRACEPSRRWHHRDLMVALARRRPTLTIADLDAVFELAPHAGWHQDDILRIATMACERLTAEQRAALVPQLEEALAVVKDPHAGPVARGLRPRLRALLPNTSHAKHGGAIDTSMITMGDGWSAIVAAQLVHLEGDPALITDALEHLAAATTGTAPTKKWRALWEAICARGDEPAIVARIFLDALLEAEPRETEVAFWGGRHQMVLSPNNSDLARGGVWAVAGSHDDDTAALLGEVALASHNENVRSGFTQGEKVTNACVTMLGAMQTPAAITQLRLLRDAIKHQGVRKQVVKALLVAARATGLRTTRLAEGSIPSFELASDGTKVLAVGTAVARVRVTGRGKPALEWFADADTGTDLAGRKPSRTPPAAIATTHADGIAALKAEVKELAKTVAAERSRLETVIGEDDPWPFATWAGAYWHHPVTGSFARALAWRVTPDANAAPFVGFAPEDPSVWIDADGTTRTVDPDAAVVRPWHPVRSTPDEVRGLRAVLTAREMAQPFKQAYREVYLLTPAEEQTAVYSNRFAAHILRYQQAFALMKERGWVTNYLGSWEAGSAGCAKRTFDDDGVTAQFFHDPAEFEDEGRYGRVELCATDQVRFVRAGVRGAAPLPLVDLDPVVFSEAMRDVDLFVGVCSIGNDPTWGDRGEHRHGDYWRGYAFGDLGASATVRREVLADILPKLKIAKRCTLEDKYLVVQGTHGLYRIHLGSANVLMDPDRYLCIVVGRGGARTGKVFLPFEDDHQLTVILSKAFLLAEDTKITDPTILRQMGVTV